MKNANEIKFLAKIIFASIILVSVILSSCSIFSRDVNWGVHIKNFRSHTEFAKFIQEYNSQSDAKISSFISFDFDNVNENFEKYYNFRTRAHHKSTQLYDNNTTDTNVEFFFYYNVMSGDDTTKTEYKIKCCYPKPNKTIFYADSFEIKTLTKEEMSGQYLINSLDYQDERLPVSVGEENKKYNYVHSLALFINGESAMSIKISCTQELDENQINAISQLLLDHLSIVCAGDSMISNMDNTSEDNLEILFGSHIPTNEPTVYQTEFFATHYFNNLTTNYGDNYIGTCSYVSIAMLLSYYDSYWNDSIIANSEDVDIYDETTVFLTTDTLERIISPGIKDDTNLTNQKLKAINAAKSDEEKQSKLTFTQYYEVVEDNCNSYFHLKLIELGRVSKICEVYEFFDINPYGLGRIGRKNLIEHYLYDYRNFSEESIWYECVTTNVEEYIVSNVSQGIPVLIAVAYADGGGHALIVYDYDEATGKLYGHMGWGANLTHIDISSMGYLYIKNAATIKINTSHSHSDNYVDSEENTYCSCYFPCHPEHEHTYEQISGDDEKHRYTCGCVANDVNTASHRYLTHQNFDSTYHSSICADCGYRKNNPHYFEYHTTGSLKHILTCSYCGATSGYAQTHVWTTSNIDGTAQCKICGYLKILGPGEFVPIIKTKKEIEEETE